LSTITYQKLEIVEDAKTIRGEIIDMINQWGGLDYNDMPPDPATAQKWGRSGLGLTKCEVRKRFEDIIERALTKRATKIADRVAEWLEQRAKMVEFEMKQHMPKNQPPLIDPWGIPTKANNEFMAELAKHVAEALMQK
jgi:hypothetical protein